MPGSDDATGPLGRLERDGLIRAEAERYRTTRRWQGAMARAAYRLLRAGEESTDLRVPIACALVEIYGADCPDAELASLVDALAPIEAAELAPSATASSRPSG